MRRTYEIGMDRALEMKIACWKRRAHLVVDSPSRKRDRVDIPTLTKIVLTSPDGSRTCLLDRTLSPRAMNLEEMEKKQSAWCLPPSRKRSRDGIAKGKFSSKKNREEDRGLSMNIVRESVKDRDEKISETEGCENEWGAKREDLQQKLGYLDVSLPELPHDKLTSPYRDVKPPQKRQRHFASVSTDAPIWA
mmetsp:Transcript_11754/g.28967  ORF Transcript_11754/g.28967 Transcript_11754/m.28967 type:complete len:191 (-) Transcript_11754:388-960(-)|eukprot:CAMPEP_0114524844 /NCGR_PEP_ID=MMETSP0109-20121206/22082_1 /TAXON_ID=29199 /ORGANISM="Chlorarachnion reptans, Strain CCCM449" /LENGTH=190 /DNA_ID=CAMNT_0001706335 /DNA_START=240 /DNA_END=812 /DNA_ORIENTATION=+